MAPASKRVPASFYRTDGGNEPVREWLKSLETEDRKAIGDDIQTAGLAGRLECRFAGR
jgi:hypothetical protein